ncbi:MAG: hypothetical protein PCFJNLEI_00102 [Verrucomicrobiae bacterium]|nr:hypothetical protein [Verrucomicrobiae bacterium]
MKPWRDPATGRDYVYVGIISTTSLVVQIDVATGRSRSFYLPPPCEGPRGMALTLDGDLLVTSTSGHLCRINPQTGKVWVTATAGKWLWTIDRGMDGKFYLGASPDSQLYRYDATSEQLEDLGSLGFGQAYLRRLVGGDDGYVYCSLGSSASQIAAYHIATGRITGLLPKSEIRPYFLDVFGRADDGQIYVVTNRNHAFRIAHGALFPAGDPEEVKQRLRLHSYWVGCHALPDGRPVRPLDPDAIRVGDKIIRYKYKTGGANIFHLAEGPHQTVYGSTIMPLYLLRYTPKTKRLENLGRGAPDNGEAYSFGHCDGKLYYANYPSGNLMVYDPAKPLHNDPPGEMKWKTNPIWLGNLGIGNCRPRALCIDARKRIWVGGVPEYGYRHGGLACYDIRRKKLSIFDKIIPDQSIDALAATDDVLYGGTNIGRGGGMEVVAKESFLFAWDTRAHTVRWKLKLFPGMRSMSNLLYRDGKLYGTSGFKFFCFDPQKRALDYLIDSAISGPREHSLCFGPDGNLYGITWMVLFRWRPATGQIEELYRCKGADAKAYPGGSLFHRGAIIIGGRYYFSCGPKIMSLPLP